MLHNFTVFLVHSVFAFMVALAGIAFALLSIQCFYSAWQVVRDMATGKSFQ